MFGDGSLTLREFAIREPLPLATIHGAILNFLRNRADAVLFDAQAVNAYVDEPKMTQNVDILSTRGATLEIPIGSKETNAAPVRPLGGDPDRVLARLLPRQI
jgi:hypothetical protein